MSESAHRRPMPDLMVLDAVGTLLGQQLALRDKQIKALEKRLDEGLQPWQPGVHRAGTRVQHHVGQHFRALKDTAAEPPGDDWQRFGSGGFRIMGGFQEGRTYLDGDLFMRDFGTFLWHGGAAHLLAGRGAKGDAGPRGKDGSEVVGLKLAGSRIVLTLRDARGDRAIETDLITLIEQMGSVVHDSIAAEARAQG
ncbi:hypothetical protein QTI17_01360 [Variovorax sp. J31P179]|uniref:hypothetical protein n=1 Tax=Variovorax sp. J31P179 TaxID=3053508 RepID=UPI0025755DEF|nr:hypothetical protein [Variovorax sp. J31P179]MDM0079229.1 hypothetical protein [Variovorax sp. J31P179]